MTFEELKGIVESLAATVVAHDNQIDGLIRVAEQLVGFGEQNEIDTPAINPDGADVLGVSARRDSQPLLNFRP